MANRESSVKRVLFNSGIYSISSVLQKAISFFLIPLYTTFLTPSDYGITGLVASFTAIISLLFTLALSGAISRFHYEYRNDKEKLREYRGTIVLFTIANSIVLSTIIIVFNTILVAPFMNNVDFYPYIIIGILTVLVTPIYTIYQSILQIEERALEYSINSVIYFLISLILNIILIVVYRLGAVGFLLSQLISGSIFALYAIGSLVIRKIIAIKFKYSYLKESLAYSIPLIPHLLSMNIANFASGFFMNKNMQLSNFGLFNVGSQFSSIIDITQSSINSAYVPWFYDRMSIGKTEHEKIIEFVDILMRLYCIINIGVALFCKEVIQIMANESYLLAWTVLPVVCLSYQVRGTYLFFVNALFYNKKATRYIFIATLTGNSISVLLSAILTPKFGLQTPGIVMLCEKIITTTIVILLTKKYEPIMLKLSKMFNYIFILIFVSAIGLTYDYINPDGPINVMIIFLKIALLFAAIFILIKSDYNKIKRNVKMIVENIRTK